MWLQNPVLTVHNVEGSHGGFVIQGKHENLVGVGQIFGRAGREDGDSKAAGYRLADGLQIVHAGYNVQGYFVFPDSGQFPFWFQNQFRA